MHAINTLDGREAMRSYEPHPAFRAALHEAQRYLETRSLTSGPALTLTAALRLAIGRIGDGGSAARSPEAVADNLLSVGRQVLDHLAARSRRPEALIRTLEEGLSAERNARERRRTCGECGAGYDANNTALRCLNCGAARTASEER